MWLFALFALGLLLQVAMAVTGWRGFFSVLIVGLLVPLSACLIELRVRLARKQNKGLARERSQKAVAKYAADQRK